MSPPAYWREARQELRGLGVCTHCRKADRSDKSEWCLKCVRARVAAQRKRRADFRGDPSRCTACGRKKRNNKRRLCKPCRDSRLRTKRRARVYFCGCGGEMMYGQKMCSVCRGIFGASAKPGKVQLTLAELRRGPGSVYELSERTGVSIRHTIRHVHRFEALGLASWTVDESSRGGKKIYKLKGA